MSFFESVPDNHDVTGEQPIDPDFPVEIDREKSIITICGIRYTFDLFRQLGFAPEGSRFEIAGRGDGIVALVAIPKTEAI